MSVENVSAGINTKRERERETERMHYCSRIAVPSLVKVKKTK